MTRLIEYLEQRLSPFKIADRLRHEAVRHCLYLALLMQTTHNFHSVQRRITLVFVVCISRTREIERNERQRAGLYINLINTFSHLYLNIYIRI